MDSLDWNLAPLHPWLHASQSKGPKEPPVWTHVSIDRDGAPAEFSEEVLIEVRSSVYNFDHVHTSVRNQHPSPDFVDFVESDHHVSICRSNFPEKLQPSMHTQSCPFLGRTFDSVVSLHPDILRPVRRCSSNARSIPSHKAEEVVVILYFTFRLDMIPERPFSYATTLFTIRAS